MSLLYSVDEYGVRNYRNLPILIVAFSIFMLIIYVAAHQLLIYELPADNENVTTFRDSFWLCFMAASTIGFGDFYPVTDGGRTVIGSMFILGSMMLGLIIGLVHNMVLAFTETGVKNREIRHQVDSLIDHNKEVEELVDQLSGQLVETYKMNEAMYTHNQLIEEKLDILMNHVDETTPELKMENIK